MKRLLLVLSFWAAVSLAQMSTSQITGTVRDPSGAVVPGASVTATNEATGVNYKQNTTDAGLYAFPALPVGTYTISVEMQGFRTIKKTSNVLVVGTPLAVDMTLEVGSANETISVEATAAQLQTESATVGNVVAE